MPTTPSRAGNTSAGFIENGEIMEIIKEEQTSPPVSMKFTASKPKISVPSQEKTCKCTSRQTKCASPQTDVTGNLENLVKEKEQLLRSEYDKLLEKKITLTRERFNFILQSEQVRACYMLREAHRERQEKIKALENQLECKNLAALMFVMCTERKRSKLEKLKLIEEYTTYINKLQDLLTEGQGLILHLSRGYKTAARVEYEWREKMKKVVGQFMKFIYHFTGGPEETNQYFIDLPKLLKTKAPIVDDPNEGPCDSEELGEEEESVKENEETKPWWESLEDDCRPFMMFGDMADFKPPERRKVLNTLKAIKAAKSAPPIWKKYVFNELVLKRSCENVDVIKDVYPNLRRLSMVSEHTQDSTIEKNAGFSKISVASRRQTTASLECRGYLHNNGNDMGSLLKIITSASVQPKKTCDKSAILGAKDSMEIQSSTKLKHMNNKSEMKELPKTNVILEIGKKCSIGDLQELHQLEETTSEIIPTKRQNKKETDSLQSLEPSEASGLGNVHHDSLEVIPSHKPDDKMKDHNINYERYCPVERCQLMQVDSFTRSLPPYMRASPYMQFQQLYEDYETCSPEQLEILKERLAAKHAVEEEEKDTKSSVSEFEKGGVGTQTSLESMLPPCTCTDGVPSPVDSKFIFDVRDLIPVKQVIDFVKKECLFDDTIDFDRFKVVGENSGQSILREPKPVIESNRDRMKSLTRILHQHPSLLDIFQANTRC